MLTMLLMGAAGIVFAQNDVVSGISVQGNRRIPSETIKARIFTKAGDIYDPAALERDFNSLWNTGYFEDIKFLRQQTPKGWEIIVQVKEKPTIREINYLGLSSVSNSDVLDRFKQEKVGLTVESQFDPTKIKKAEFDQEPAVGAWQAVRDDSYRDTADSSGSGGHHVRGKGRAEG